MHTPISRIVALSMIAMMLMSCRGQTSEKPPVHLNQNMDFQDRFNAQEKNSFFADNRSMRQPVEGTIPRGGLRQNTEIFEGLDENGDFVDAIPVEVTRDFIERGRNSYEIYCSVCHGGTGDGQGIIMTGNYGYVPAPTFHSDRIRGLPDGEIYSAIANGVRNMPSYASQIKVEDRWAIVTYVRALQRSQYVPESEMDQFDVDLAQLRSDFTAEQERQEALAAAREAAAGEEEVTAQRGERLYVQNACNACHSVDGSAVVGPSFAGLYGKERNFTDGTSTTADDAYITESIVQPDARIVEGYQNVMANYSYLSEGEIQSIIEFIKTLSDN
ncbi:MAG: c-type cytochrome [Balneolaceae bacterium]|nr:c-type cytochrome [Balneolaceae bacterium]